VSTTRARLQHLFGADFRFEFHRLEQGVAVVVAVPWRTDTQPATTPSASAEEDDWSSPRPPERAQQNVIIRAIGATGARA